MRNASAAQPHRVVLSLALNGNEQDQRCTVTNILGQTHAPLVVHFSFVGGGSLTASTRAALQASGRGHENPRRLRAGRLAPGILHAHLSNVEHAVRVLLTTADTRFVFLASNMLIGRPGLEEWVAHHPLAFCVHNDCTDVPCTEADVLRRDCASRLAAELSWPAARNETTALSRAMRSLAAARNDARVRTDPWVSRFVGLLGSGRANGNATGWRAAPANMMPHEGSWYPRRVLDGFRRALAGTPFETAMQIYDKERPRSLPCPCCALYGLPHGGSQYSTNGSCAFEELLLPTYVWQRWPELLPRAAPPLALRVWQIHALDVRGGRLDGRGGSRAGNASSLYRGLDAAASAVLANRAAHPHVFAIKVPHRRAAEIAAAFRSTFRDRGSCRVPVML